MKNIRSVFGAALFLFSSLISSKSNHTLDACGIAAKAFEDASAAGAVGIPAKIAYDCLTAIPLHKDQALYTLHQIRLYLQFYSAQAYFADPPTEELELFPIDTNKTLDSIESHVRDGKYKNEYSFNQDLFYLFGYFRDGHTTFNPTCYSAFLFQHRHALLPVAKTPDSIPEIYGIEATTDGKIELGEKVIKINGEDAIDYMADFANTHPELNWIDPDARWNEAMIYLQSGKPQPGPFSRSYTYNDEDLTITWENGLTTTVEWFAEIPKVVSFDSIETFYSNVCLRGEDEMKTALEQYTDTTTETTKHKREKRHEITLDYPLFKRGKNTTYSVPEPVMLSEDSLLSLYVIDDDTGVLVISSFNPEDGAENAFSVFIGDSIAYLQGLGIKKIIIDLTGNGGGFVNLGTDAVLQFFPKSDHFFGSSMRWSPALDALLTKGVVNNESYWDLGYYHKMDGSDFSSYEEFLGPVHKDNDYFTVIARPDIVETNLEGSYGLPTSYPGPQPFKTENIILLSSGRCGSTCAVFAEAMVGQGVRSVAFGGRPRDGPMQTVGGIKGSQVLEFDEIAAWEYAFLGEDVNKYDYIPEVLNIALSSARVNLRNSWRKDDQDTPIEFIYDPAEYKLSYTLEMYMYLNVMWEAARDVAWYGGSYMGNSNSEEDEGTGDGTPVVASTGAFKDKEDEVIGVGVDSDDDEDGDDDEDDHPTKTWNSIGELIWQKINGRGSGLNITI